MSYLFLVLGFAILIIGGDLLVRGSSGLAIRAKISPLVVGLTVVSFGTSAPELFASIQAAFMDFPNATDISVGNVIGSNIANLGLVLGITSLIFPLVTDPQILRQDWPMVMIASLAFFFFALDGEISFIDGAIFLSSLIFLTVYLIARSMSKEKLKVLSVEELKTYEKAASQGYVKLFGLIAVGCAALYFGSKLFLDGAIDIAKSYNISGHVIGVTIVAFGTSIPELAASVIAAFRKEADISIGNLLGSNIFNILGVLGITSMIKTLPVGAEVMSSDVFWMIGVAFILLPMIVFRKKIGRIDGLILLTIYIVYIVKLVLT
jgi:cation:H+ antiporter